MITTKGKRKYAQNESDWQFLFSEIPKKLQQLADDSHAIVIFTNQNGLDKHMDPTGVQMRMFRAKIEDVFTKVQFDLLLFVHRKSNHA